MASGPIAAAAAAKSLQSCPTLCDPMNRSTPSLPVHHQLREFTQTHVHRVSDAIHPSHPLLSPSPPRLSRLVITFLPRSKRLLISWLQMVTAAMKLKDAYSLEGKL